MKKVLSVIILFSLFLPIFASAQALPNPVSYDNIPDLIEALIDFLFNIALLVAPMMIIIGGFYLVTAAGDPSKIATGKNLILYAMIGFIIILISKGLVEAIKIMLGVK